MLALEFYIMFEMICSLAQKFKNKTFQCTCMSLGWIFSVIQMQLNKDICKVVKVVEMVCVLAQVSTTVRDKQVRWDSEAVIEPV